MENQLPFEEYKINKNTYLRVFKEDTKSNELQWHRDREDRIITVAEETDWLFQMDDELPIKIYSDSSIFIPKGVYHRLIKGNSDLNLIVKKL